MPVLRQAQPDPLEVVPQTLVVEVAEVVGDQNGDGSARGGDLALDKAQEGERDLPAVRGGV